MLVTNRSAYAYTDLLLTEVAGDLDNAERRAWLSCIGTICKYATTADYLEPGHPATQMRLEVSFVEAIANGAEKPLWHQARLWVLENVSFASVPESIWDTYAPH